MKTIREFMTADPTACLPTDPAHKAAAVMRGEDVGAVPIVADEKSKQLVGIITDRDLAVNVIAGNLDPKTTKLEQLMTRDPARVRVNDDLGKAVDTMRERRIRRLPVVDDRDHLVGILSQADVATRLGDPQTTGKMLEHISQPTASSRR